MKNINLKTLTTAFLFLLAYSAVLKSMPVDKQVSLAVGSSFVAHDAEAKFAFSQDGNILASVDSSGTISLQDLTNGVVLAVLPGNANDTVTSLAFSPDGVTLASSAEGSITLWDFVSGTQRTISSAQPEITHLVFSPDGIRLAGIDQNKVLVWDVASGAQQLILEAGNATLTAFAFSPDGGNLASSYSDGRITLWDMSDGQQLSSIEISAVTAITGLAFNSAGLLAAVDEQAKIFLLDPDSGYQQQILEGQQELKAFAFSPDGAKLASSDPEARIKLWDVGLAQQPTSADNAIAPSTVVTGLSFNVDSDILAGISGDDLIALWNVATGELLQTLIGHLDRVAGIAFSSNDSTLASIGYDGQLIIWDLTTGQELFTNQIIATGAIIQGQQADNTETTTAATAEIPVSTTSSTAEQTVQADAVDEDAEKKGKKEQLVDKPDPRDWKGVTALSVSPDGSTHSSGHKGGEVRIWDGDGKELAVLKRHKGDVTGVAYSADGKSIVTVSKDTTINVWNANTKEWRQTMHGPEHPIRAVAVSEKSIAVGGESTRLMLYNPTTGKLEDILTDAHPDFINAIAFNSDGSKMVTGGVQGLVILWDMQDRKVVHTYRGHADEITSVVFAGKNSEFIVSGSEDKQVKVWDVNTGGPEILNLSGHADGIRSVRATKNGKFVISAGKDGKVMKWDVRTGKSKVLSEGSAEINAMEITSDGELFVGDELGQIEKHQVDQVN